MKKLFHVLAAVVLALALLPASSGQAAVPTIRVMALGDSLTNGYGSSDARGYKTPLDRLLAGRVDILWTREAAGGHAGGGTVQDIRAGVSSWLVTDRPDVVILSIGTNNAAGVPPGMAGFEAALKDVVGRIVAYNPAIRIYLGVIQYSNAPWAAREVDVNVAVIYTSWAFPQVTLVEFELIHACLLFDGVHPYDAGYAWMARQVYRAMQPAYGLPDIPPDTRSVARPGYERPPVIPC